uniref:Uncharacterized protein n=1 Tax=Magallana gigas TaxID=29159 RepID=A0A8W8NH30_MAGGI
VETWFKVTAHSLLKITLWVKYEPYWAKGREDMLRTGYPGWTDRQTDEDTDHYRAPAERGSKK